MTNPGCARFLFLLFPAVATLVSTASCRQGIVPASAVMHPTEENLPPPGGPLIRADTVISGLSSPERAAAWAAARRALLDATPVTSVGTPDGSGPDLLGTVGDVAGDGEGNVYIQDKTTQEVLLFNAAGDFLQRMGGEGEGPEEFRSLRGFVRLPDGRLVAGQYGGPAKVLVPGGNGYEFAGRLLRDQVTETLAVNDMCALADRIFVHSNSLAGGELVIHELSADSGSVVASLAEPYRSDFAWDRQRRSNGRIACGMEPATLVWGFYYFPIVKAYRPDNTLLWTALIEDFTQGLIYQNNATSRTVHPMGPPTEYVVAAHALKPGFVVLQTWLHEIRTNPENGERVRESLRRRTYLLDQETGNGGLVSDSLPRIAWIGDSTYAATWSFPYPRVEVRLMPRRESGQVAQEPQ